MVTGLGERQAFSDVNASGRASDYHDPSKRLRKLSQNLNSWYGCHTASSRPDDYHRPAGTTSSRQTLSSLPLTSKWLIATFSSTEGNDQEGGLIGQGEVAWEWLQTSIQSGSASEGWCLKPVLGQGQLAGMAGSVIQNQAKTYLWILLLLAGWVRAFQRANLSCAAAPVALGTVNPSLACALSV